MAFRKEGYCSLWLSRRENHVRQIADIDVGKWYDYTGVYNHPEAFLKFLNAPEILCYENISVTNVAICMVHFLFVIVLLYSFCVLLILYSKSVNHHLQNTLISQQFSSDLP